MFLYLILNIICKINKNELDLWGKTLDLYIKNKLNFILFSFPIYKNGI